MGPMNDDDEMVTRPAATSPVRSDSPRDPDAAGERGDNDEGAEEGLGPGGPGMPGIEEAGYGYGV